MILEGSDGQSFFLKETLLAEGLADRVDLVSRAEQAIAVMDHSNPYNLVVINLVEAWEQGMQLGFWLTQKAATCPVILIVPPESSESVIENAPFMVLSAPLSLHDFTKAVRTALVC